MIRQTSIDTYHRIEREGLLSSRRWEVYSALFKNGPLTRNEIGNYVNIPGYHSNISARLTELREMGVIIEVGEKKCSMTGNSIILWDVTDKLPTKAEDNKTNVFKYQCEECKQEWGTKPGWHSTLNTTLFQCFGEIIKWKKMKK